MREELLKKILSKLRKDEYTSFLHRWRPSEQSRFEDISEWNKLTKKDIITRILKSCSKMKLSLQDIGELDLLYTQTYTRKKLWSTYKLKPIQGSEVRLPPNLDQQLRKAWNMYYKVAVCCGHTDQLQWIWMYFHDKTSSKFVPSNLTYMVHVIDSPFIMIANLKAKFAKHIMQGLRTTLSCAKVEDMNLRGRCVHSLAQIAINSLGQGHRRVLKPLNKGDNTGKRKRKRFDDADQELNCNVIQEEQAEKRKRWSSLDEAFGVGSQPVLEKVEFRLETQFQGCQYAQGMVQNKQPFHCRVRFEGASVLDGIRQMGEAGLAQVPMKNHLTQLHSLGKNVFVLRQRRQ